MMSSSGEGWDGGDPLHDHPPRRGGPLFFPLVDSKEEADSSTAELLVVVGG